MTLCWSLAALTACDAAPAVSEADVDGVDEVFGLDPSAPPESEPPEVSVYSGRWSAEDFPVLEDPCGLDDSLRAFGWDPSLLLPQLFDVQSSESGFRIQAVDYGAQDEIVCTVSGRAFTCEPQTVVPVDDFGFGEYGWVYEIVFSGEVQTGGLIEGTVVTSFPEIGTEWLDYARAYGIELEGCTQTHSLLIAALEPG